MRTQAEVMLTDQGKADALSLGKAIRALLGSAAVWHSPVPRCRQTAEFIAQGIMGAGGGGSVQGPLGWLAGIIETDFGWVGQQIESLQHNGFLRNWFDGRYAPQQITPLAEAATRQMDQVIRQLEQSHSRVVIGVTHDWPLLVLREHYLRLRHEDVGVPPYLDSVAVLKSASGTFLWSLGCSVELPSVR